MVRILILNCMVGYIYRNSPKIMFRVRNVESNYVYDDYVEGIVNNMKTLKTSSQETT